MTETKYQEYKRKAAQLDKIMQIVTRDNHTVNSIDGGPNFSYLKPNQWLQISGNQNGAQLNVINRE